VISTPFNQGVPLDARYQNIEDLLSGELQFVQNSVIHLLLQICQRVVHNHDELFTLKNETLRLLLYDI